MLAPALARAYWLIGSGSFAGLEGSCMGSPAFPTLPITCGVDIRVLWCELMTADTMGLTSVDGCRTITPQNIVRIGRRQ